MVSRYNDFVKDMLVDRLLEINRDFYSNLGLQFSDTRQKIQPGVSLIIETIPRDASILDIGCGNGSLWLALKGNGYRGKYIGVDNSQELITIARSKTTITTVDPGKPGKAFNHLNNVEFLHADISNSKWASVLTEQQFDLILVFSVLHHLPGQRLRLRLLKQINDLLAPSGVFFHSEWQFLNSKRLRSKIIPWEIVGIDELDLDPHDYLLDWKSGGYGLRYVHHFGLRELEFLALKSGFQIKDTFLSDGADGNLGLYQRWQK